MNETKQNKTKQSKTKQNETKKNKKHTALNIYLIIQEPPFSLSLSWSRELSSLLVCSQSVYRNM